MEVCDSLILFSFKYSMGKSVVSIVLINVRWTKNLIYNQFGVTVYVIWNFKTGILYTFIAPSWIL